MVLAEMCPLSLHDALPIYVKRLRGLADGVDVDHERRRGELLAPRFDERTGAAQAPLLGAGERHDHRVFRGIRDRKSTRLNSSHMSISYAVFCLKKTKMKPL